MNNGDKDIFLHKPRGNHVTDLDNGQLYWAIIQSHSLSNYLLGVAYETEIWIRFIALLVKQSDLGKREP